MGRPRLYSEEEKIEKAKEYKHKWYLKHKERILKEKKVKYKGSNKYKTMEGRAYTLIHSYNHNDIKYGRGIGNLTTDWVIENILSKPCVHCGESNWKELGCNRLDNSKPHTIDNVEPCCWKCNHRLATEEKRKPLDQIDKVTGEIIKTWESAYAVEKAIALNATHISSAARGQRKTCGGYIWKII